ncbi:MAG: VWA domain-containing protein [Gammaproteobacteria bacterium]|nr:VWA domain-containing protein [Gammaproteobacteria bacterium]
MPVQFEQPLWFILIPLALLLYFIVSRFTRLKVDQKNPDMISLYLPLINDKLSEKKQPLGKPANWINWLILVLMLTALSQPVIKEKRSSSPDTLRDIIFVIDTSVGMSIRDYKLKSDTVDRLTLLKAVLTRFIDTLQGNRIGLMVYADEAYTLIPLTKDKNLLYHGITKIQMATAGRQNNLSNALNSVIKQFDFAEHKPSIVVLSQGANIEGDISPYDVAESFRQKNIKLHFVGLGSGQQNNDHTIRLIFDPINIKLLKTMSSITGGEFFWAGESQNLNTILAAIADAETINVNKADHYLIQNYYIYLLYPVLLICIFLSLLNIFQSRIR